MRPDILNPLFAEVEVLKGIGPQLAKPLHRLKLDRVVDILLHLPVGWIDRKRVGRLDEADVGRTITIARIADSSGAMKTARPFAARARSAASQGRKPAGAPASVIGLLAERIFWMSDTYSGCLM